MIKFHLKHAYSIWNHPTLSSDKKIEKYTQFVKKIHLGKTHDSLYNKNAEER